MNRFILRAGIVLLCLTVLLLLAFSFTSPILYGPENATSTPSHLNPQVLKKISRDESSLILPLVQDVLDGTGTVTLSLQGKDFRTAERELRTCLDRSAHLGNLVIQLNLSDTDLDQLQHQNEENLANLQELLNLTERFAELEKIEVTYRQEGRSDLLYSVSYEGEAIRSKVGALAQEYTAREGTVINSSRSFGLNGTAYQQSVSGVQVLTQEVVARQTDRAVTLEKVPVSPFLLTLYVQPSTATYGDEIQFSGSFITAPSSAGGVSLFIDSVLWKESPVDRMGSYQIVFPVQRIRAGNHIVYALHNHTFTDIRQFTIRSQPTRMTLAAQMNADQRIECSGTLFTGAIPVSFAPVEILSDGKPVRTVYTNAQGGFTTSLNLSPPEHRIKARFSSREFPLDPSEAETTITALTGKGSSSLPVLLAGGVFIVFSLGAIWVAIRGRIRKEETIVHPPERHPAPLSEETPMEEVSLVLTTYWGLLWKGNVQEAVHLLYRSLIERIARQRRITHAPALTPREVAEQVPDLSPSFPAFVRSYERIRYEGKPPSEEEREEFPSRFASLIRLLRGDSH